MATSDSIPLEIPPAAVKGMLDESQDILLLDCREADEHAKAHIDGAKLLPMSELAGRLHEIAADRERNVVVHCHHGGRSLRVARFLREQGFTRAQSMAGGIDQWAVEIDPTVPRY
jgi:rhodanese-related sulfurtransferase